MPARLRITTAISGVLIAVLGMASPAFADSWSITDPAHDMVGYCDNTPTDCPAGGTDPSRTDGDMLQSTLTHSAKNLMVKSYFTELNKPGTKSGTWTFIIQTFADNKYRNFQVAVATGGVKHGKSTNGITFLFNKDNDTLVSCSGRQTSIDYTGNTIRVIIPRTCLKNPYKLRIGAFFYQRPTTASGLDGYRDRTLGSYGSWVKHS